MGCCRNRGTASKDRMRRRVYKAHQLREQGYSNVDIAIELDTKIIKIEEYLRDWEYSKLWQQVTRRVD